MQFYTRAGVRSRAQITRCLQSVSAPKPRMAAAATSVDSHQHLQQLCEAAGQQHLLEDWASLTTSEQQQLADDIQVSTLGCFCPRNSLQNTCAQHQEACRQLSHTACSLSTHTEQVSHHHGLTCAKLAPTAILLCAGPGLQIHQESAASQPSSSSGRALKVPADHRRSDTASKALLVQHPTPASVHQLHRQQLPALLSMHRAVRSVQV